MAAEDAEAKEAQPVAADKVAEDAVPVAAENIPRANLIGGGASLRHMLEGSEAKGITAPPTQTIVNEFADVWQPRQEPDENAEEELAKETMPAWALESLAASTEIILRTANAAVNGAVTVVFEEKPEVPNNIINLAGRQRILLLTMAKEVVLYFLLLSTGVTEAASHHMRLVDEASGTFA